MSENCTNLITNRESFVVVRIVNTSYFLMIYTTLIFFPHCIEKCSIFGHILEHYESSGG